MKTDNPAFAPVDLLTADLEIDTSIYKGFAAAIMVKGQPRMIALCREYADAVQLMAIIDASRTPAADADRVRIAVEEVADAVDFFDRVKASTQAEQIAVGRDHWNRLEAAARAVAALKSEGK